MRDKESENSGEGCTLQSAAEYKRAPFCPTGVLRRVPLPHPRSLSLSLSPLTTKRSYPMHTLIRSCTRMHTGARFSSPFPLASPPPVFSYLLSSFRFFSRFLYLFYVWTSRVRRKGCCALRMRNSRDIDKNKVHPPTHTPDEPAPS